MVIRAMLRRGIVVVMVVGRRSGRAAERRRDIVEVEVEELAVREVRKDIVCGFFLVSE